MLLKLKLLNDFHKVPLNCIKLSNISGCSRKMLSTSGRRCFPLEIATKKLLVEPETCLHDEPICIKVKGMKPGAEVTLTSTTQDSRQDFFSYAHYRADSFGGFNIENHEAIGGSYQGVFPMGPITCLAPAPNTRKKMFFINNFSSPLLVKMKLLQGHLGESEAFKPDPRLIIDTVNHHRIYLSSGCKRIPVKYGNIRGVLFLPAGEGPFPGIVDIYGMRGGLFEFRAAQLSSRGIATLALAYFRYDDLPEELEEVNLEYFEEAVHFLLNHDKIKKPSVGVIGSSKGGDIGLSMGTFIPQVKAVVCVSGFPVISGFPLKFRDMVIPALPFNYKGVTTVASGKRVMKDCFAGSEDYPESWLPLHEADAEFLFVVGKDDHSANLEFEVSAAIERLKAKGKSNFKVLAYEGAGHLLEPPYNPYCNAHFSQLVKEELWHGGNPKDHAVAQVCMWDQILKFFKRILS